MTIFEEVSVIKLYILYILWLVCVDVAVLPQPILYKHEYSYHLLCYHMLLLKVLNLYVSSKRIFITSMYLSIYLS